MAVNPSTARPGQSITVQVTTTAPPPDSSTRTWLALFEAGGKSHLGQWKWLHDGQDCAFTFRAPDAPGQYEFRYFLDSGYDKVAARGYLTVQ